MDLNIHLIECFLQVRHVFCRYLDQTGSMPPERADSADHAWWSEAGCELADRPTLQVLRQTAHLLDTCNRSSASKCADVGRCSKLSEATSRRTYERLQTDRFHQSSYLSR